MDNITSSVALQVSVVIIARNEAHNIEACLTSVKNFDEVLLLDNGSIDDTVERAEQYPNTRVIKTDWKGYGATRQIGVDAAKHDWIFWIDADEQITPALETELRLQITALSQESILSLPRRNFFLGKHIRGCGWSPDRVFRVFNRKFTRFDTKAVHEGLTSTSAKQVIKLEHPLLHYSYSNIRQFFEKNLRYAMLAAEERYQQRKSISGWQLFLRPIWEFFRSYVIKKGFLDGLHGLAISGGSAVYVFTRDTTCYFLKHTASNKAQVPLDSLTVNNTSTG